MGPRNESQRAVRHLENDSDVTSSLYSQEKSPDILLVPECSIIMVREFKPFCPQSAVRPRPLCVSVSALSKPL